MVDNSHTTQRLNRPAVTPTTVSQAETGAARQLGGSGSNRFGGRDVQLLPGRSPLPSSNVNVQVPGAIRTSDLVGTLKSWQTRRVASPAFERTHSTRASSNTQPGAHIKKTLVSAGVPESYADFIASTIENRRSAAE